MSVGPTSMTMDDVARACGISKRTLYETFPEAVTAANGEKITLLADISEAYTLYESQTLRIIERKLFPDCQCAFR